jgi:hypothetical protein
MAKNPRRHQENITASGPRSVQPGSTVSARGKKVIYSGIGIVILGFWVLTYTDPAGQNWASTLSPALLVFGYALIGLGIVLPDPPPINKPTH